MSILRVAGEPSFITNPGARGAQLFSHVRLTRTGALDVVQLFVEQDGAPEASRFETSRRRLREQLDKLRDGGMRAAPVSGEYVAWRIRHEADAARAAGATFSTMGEQDLASLPAIATPPPHPASGLPMPPDVTERVMRSAALLGEPEMITWLPPQSTMAEVLKGLESMTSTIAQPGQTEGGSIAERGSKVVEAAIDASYDAAARRSLATHLRDAAVVMDASRKSERALDAIALADAVESTSVLTTPPHSIPFIVALVFKAMQMARLVAAQEASGSPLR